MQVSLGINVPSVGNSAGGAAAPFVPTDVSGNILWLDSMLGITLGGTMRAAGTTPPVVTLTGTLTQATAILLDMPVGGARGTAEFRWSFDNGATWSAQTLTAATVAIGATGVTANFPVGTYNTDNTYRTTVATWADQGPGSNNVIQATAGTQPMYVYDSTFGANVVDFSTASTRLAKTTGGLAGDAAHSMWGRIKLTTTSGTNQGFFAVGTSQTTLLVSHVATTTTSVINYGTHNAYTPTGSTLVNGTIYNVGKTHVTGGGADQGYLNGATDGSTVSRTYNFSAGFTIGARVNSSATSAPAQHRRVLMYSTVPSAGEITNINTWLSS